MNIIFDSLLTQLVKYDVHTTHKIKSIHAIFYHILFYVNRFKLTSLSYQFKTVCTDKKLAIWFGLFAQERIDLMTEKYSLIFDGILFIQLSDTF